jgi:adhesin transport system membrane fusion protein
MKIMNRSLSLQQVTSAYRARKIVWLSTLLFIALIVWAWFSKLDEVVVAEGKVVPSRAVQNIQSLEGGIVEAVAVQEGQLVRMGEVLMVLDNTRFRSAFQETEQTIMLLRDKVNTLNALLEAVNVSVNLDESVGWRQQVQLSLSTPLDQADRLAFRETISHLRNQLAQASEYILQQEKRLAEEVSRTGSAQASKESLDKEVRLISNMVDQGAVAEVERLQLERQQIELAGEISALTLSQRQLESALIQSKQERLNIALEFRSKSQQELIEVEGELERLLENQVAVSDALERTELRTPVDGVVKHISTRSLGGVVQPGEIVMEVVPLDDKLLVEAHVNPKDIALLTDNLSAMVKFSAFDFVIYGGLIGHLVHISPDALQKEDGTTYYKVYIETAEKSLDSRPLIPGMQATVDILTGQKTVLNYWLKPLLRAKAEALREP